VLLKLSVTYAELYNKPFMLTVTMLSIVMMSVIMLTAVMLSVVMLIVVAPQSFGSGIDLLPI
jgi:hypothetical protein